MLGRYLSIIYRQQQKYVYAAVKKYNMGYTGWNFLLYISVNPGTSQKEMCSELAIDEALATRTVRKLEKQGLLERKKEGKGSRSYSIYLTETGEKMIPRLRKILGQWWEEISFGINEEGWNFITEIMKGMADRALSANYTEEREEKYGK